MMSRPKTPTSTFIGIASFQVLAMFRRGLFYTFLSIYLRFFIGLSVTETTFFATFPMILNIVFQAFVWGVISDKYQKRRTLIILGEVFAGISTLFVWFFHTLPEGTFMSGYIIILGMSFVEIFWSMSNIGWSAIISDLYPQHERTSVQGKLASIGAGGRIIGVWIGGLAYDGLGQFYEGWGFHRGLLFFVASAIMLVSTIPMFFVPEGGVATSHQAKSESQFTQLFRLSRPFLFFLIAMVFINFGRNSIAMIKAQYLVLDEGFNVSSCVLSYIVNMYSAAILILGFFMTRLSRRYSDELLLTAGTLLAAFSLLVFAFAQHLLLIFISNFLFGASEVIILAASYTYASKLIPSEQRGKQFALFNATFFLSWGVAGTLVAGPIADLLMNRGYTQVFSYQMSFVSAVILLAIGLFVLSIAYRINRLTRTTLC